MSYQVLARKWRPQRFSELVGQSHVVSAITHALNNNRLHHAYLFTGTRGVGKTTIARIFSKSLNCELGQSADPCGKCDTCLSIEQGNYVDLLEIDAASRTKVEDTRELLDNVQYKPTRGQYKVYLIDEVHMLSKHSFNALLKTLEEPPPHIKFLLATTDPQKLPVTILSRCLQFNLKALPRQQISDQLALILAQESIPAEPAALQALSRAANGSMRDALSLTDQAIAQGDNRVDNAVVIEMLGLMDRQLLLKLLNAVVAADKSSLQIHIQTIVEQSPDYSQVLSELSSLLHQVALTQWVPEACKLETTSARAIYTLAKQLKPEHVQLLYKFVLEGKRELPYSADGRTCLEMTVMRMLHFAPRQSKQETHSAIIAPEPAVMDDLPSEQPDAPVQPQEELHAMQAEQSLLEAQKVESNIDVPSETPSPSPLQKTQALLALKEKLANENTKEETDSFVKKSEPVIEEEPITERDDIHNSFEDEAEAPPWVTEDLGEVVEEQSAEFTDTNENLAVTPANEKLTAYLQDGKKLIDAAQINGWANTIELTSLSGLTKQILLHSSFSKTGANVKLLVDSTQEHLLNEQAIEHIQKAIRRVLNENLNISISLGEPTNTPYLIQQDITAMRQDHAKQLVETNELINALKDTFDAKVDPASIHPR